jgi:hypothetical protein
VENFNITHTTALSSKKILKLWSNILKISSIRVNKKQRRRGKRQNQKLPNRKRGTRTGERPKNEKVKK